MNHFNPFSQQDYGHDPYGQGGQYGGPPMNNYSNPDMNNDEMMEPEIPGEEPAAPGEENSSQNYPANPGQTKQTPPGPHGPHPMGMQPNTSWGGPSIQFNIPGVNPMSGFNPYPSQLLVQHQQQQGMGGGKKKKKKKNKGGANLNNAIGPMPYGFGAPPPPPPPLPPLPESIPTPPGPPPSPKPQGGDKSTAGYTGNPQNWPLSLQ